MYGYIQFPSKINPDIPSGEQFDPGFKMFLGKKFDAGFKNTWEKRRCIADGQVEFEEYKV